MISKAEFESIAAGDLIVFSNNEHTFTVKDIEIGDPRNPHGAIKLNLIRDDGIETFAYRADMDIADFVYEDDPDEDKPKDDKPKTKTVVRKVKKKPAAKLESK